MFTVVLVILVAGMMVAVKVMGKYGSDRNTSITITIAQMHELEQYLRAFAMREGRLPRPANSSYPIDHELFGVEVAATTDLDPDKPRAYIGPDVVTGKILRGDFPFRTVGMSDYKKIFTPDGTRIVYEVQEDATELASCASLQQAVMKQASTQQPDRALIRIRDESGGIKDHVFWALLSQGPDGLNNLGVPIEGAEVSARQNTGFADADTLTNGVPDPSQFRDILVQREWNSQNPRFDDTLYYPNNFYKHVCCLKPECIADPSPQTGFKYEGEGASDHTGWSIASGDVDNDGIDDLVIGAPLNNTVYVVFGTMLGFPNPLPLSSLDGTNGFKISGGFGDLFGWSVAVGDVNGDAVADIVITDLKNVIEWFNCPAPQGNPAYVLLGHSFPGTWPAEVSFVNLGGVWTPGNTPGFTIGGNGLPKSFGYSAAVADINGDDTGEIVIGTYSGDVKIIWGQKPSFIWPAAPNVVDVNTLAVTGMGARIISDANVSNVASRPDYPTGTWNFASSMATGDVNGDGLSDIVIAAPKSTRLAANAGAAYVVFGSTNFPAELQLQNLNGSNGARIDAHISNRSAGVSIAVGDMNNDDIDDIGIGAPSTDAKPTYVSAGSLSNTGLNGVAYFVMGRSVWPSIVATSDFDGTNGFMVNGPAANDYFGASLAIGDVNGDGFADAIIGAPRDDPDLVNDAGSAYIIYGTDAGFSNPMLVTVLDGTTVSRIKGSIAGQRVGWAVAAGDLNRDALQDVLVTSPYADFGQGLNSGGGYVWFGNSAMVSDLDAENMP